jgi:hypothetical protein
MSSNAKKDLEKTSLVQYLGKEKYSGVGFTVHNIACTLGLRLPNKIHIQIFKYTFRIFWEDMFSSSWSRTHILILVIKKIKGRKKKEKKILGTYFDTYSILTLILIFKLIHRLNLLGRVWYPTEICSGGPITRQKVVRRVSGPAGLFMTPQNLLNII